MKRFLKWVCLSLWQAGEAGWIPLGNLTPYVLGGILGRWPHKRRKSNL